MFNSPSPSPTADGLHRKANARRALRVTYNNVQRSDANAHTILESCKDHHIIFLAEPHIFDFGHTRGTALHPNFHLLNPNLSKNCRLTAYVNKRLGSNIRFTINDHLAEITTGGCRVTGIYADQHGTPDQLYNLLNSIRPHPKSCILGDFNAHHASFGKKTNRRGEEVVRWSLQRNLSQLVPHNTVTWKRGDKTSTLDLVFADGNTQFLPLPLHLSFFASDHCLLSGELNPTRTEEHSYSVPNWDFFQEYAEDPPPFTPTTYGQGYTLLKTLFANNRISKRASSRSKKWWDQEIDQQLFKCRRATQGEDLKSQKKALHKMIKRKKRECWSKFLQQNGHKDPWHIVRIAKDPFAMKARLNTIKEGEASLSSPSQILDAFKMQHLLTEGTPTPSQQPATSPIPYQQASPHIVKEVLRALARTKNNSSPGPDGISYRLLRMIQDTDLGKAVINDIARNIELPSQTPPPWDGLKMVMIPKPNKDLNTVNGWRPIVLSNTSSKLGEKVVADRLQRATQGFHQYQYGSRKGRSAIDAMAISVSRIIRVLGKGARVSLLGKDIVSAFNHLRHGPTLDTIRANSPGDLDFVRQFLHPHHFLVFWDGAPRGWACIEEGTPQGSPLSPVLWLLFLAITLKKADTACQERLPLLLLPSIKYQTRSSRTETSPPKVPQVELFSYADDVNPVVVTWGTSKKEHARVTREVDNILVEVAKDQHLTWDPRKDTQVDFGDSRPIQHTTTLGITICSNLSFQKHIDNRFKKAERIWHVMRRLGNSNGGMSPIALRLLYTGMIRPIFTWGAEIWLHNPPNYSAFRRLEYEALRRITGSYHGASHEKPGYIGNIEPIQDKLADMGACWAAKAIATGDPLIRAIVEENVPGQTAWHDGTGGPSDTRDTPVSTAFHLTATSIPEEISWGDSQDHQEGHLLHVTLLKADDPKSREKGYWAASLARLSRDGWCLAYSDGSGANSHIGSGAYVHEGGSKTGDYLGTLASVADGERRGIALAISLTPKDRKVCVLSDSSTAIHTALRLSAGDPPRSDIERGLRESFLAHSQPTAVAWVRGHIGLEGNNTADHLARLHSFLGVVSLSPQKVTHEGLKAASRNNRKASRTQPGFGKRRTDWHRHALSAYTWLRTERGPQKAWLFQIRKSQDPSCPCGHPIQTGDHITFHCPLHQSARNRYIRSRKSWPELDDPVWVKEGDEEAFDAIESFFDYLYHEL